MQRKRQKKSCLSSRSIKQNLIPNQTNKIVSTSKSKSSVLGSRQIDKGYQISQRVQRDPSFLKKSMLSAQSSHNLSVSSTMGNINSRAQLCTNSVNNTTLSGKIMKQIANYKKAQPQYYYENFNVKSFFNTKNQNKRELNKSKSQSRATIQIHLKDSQLIKNKTNQQDYYTNSEQLSNQSHRESIEEQYCIKGEFSGQQQLFNMKRVQKVSQQYTTKSEIGNNEQIKSMMKQQLLQRRICQLQHIEELDRIECKMFEIREKYVQISANWDNLLNQTEKVNKQQEKLKELEQQISILKRKTAQRSYDLFLLNKDYLNQRIMREYTSQGQKDSLLLEAENLHNQLKTKLQQNKFEQIISFNIKVLLPSRARSISPISKSNHSKGIHVQSKNNDQQLTNKCQTNQFQITQNNMSLSQVFSSKNLDASKRRGTFGFQNQSNRQLNQVKGIVMMYQQLFRQKAAKKFALIVKKNNLGPSQAKHINQFLRRIIQLQNSFIKMQNFKANCPESFQLYVSDIQKLVQQIDQLNCLIQVLQKNKQQIEEKYIQSKQDVDRYKYEMENYLRNMDEKIKKEYAKQNSWTFGIQMSFDFIKMLRKDYQNDFEQYKLLTNRQKYIKVNDQKNKIQLLKLIKQFNQ